MRQRVAGLAFVLALALAGTARADTLEEVFRAGNDAYFRGDHAEAVERYEELVELGVRDADVFYNLGTAYARQGRLGRAVAAYERALVVRPGDSEAEAARERALGALTARRAEREGEATSASGEGLGTVVFGRMSRDALAVAVIVLDALLFAVLSALLFARREAVRLGLGVAAPLLAIGLAIAGVGLAVRAGAFDEGERAIVVRDRLALREGPREEAQERARIREGERAWIVGRDGEWVRLRAGGREGWVLGEGVVAVE